jgi:hypothetical protein
MGLRLDPRDLRSLAPAVHDAEFVAAPLAILAHPAGTPRPGNT